MGEKFLTHYQVLGLARMATEREIKIAYRKAARIAHPDRGGDPALFRQVTQAYEILVDPARRERYDKSYGAPPPPRPARTDRAPEHTVLQLPVLREGSLHTQLPVPPRVVRPVVSLRATAIRGAPRPAIRPFIARLLRI